MRRLRDFVSIQQIIFLNGLNCWELLTSIKKSLGLKAIAKNFDHFVEIIWRYDLSHRSKEQKFVFDPFVKCSWNKNFTYGD